jgi:hypothetical protein
MDAKETDLAREAERDLAAFEAWFTARPNQPLSPFEIAILKTYVAGWPRGLTPPGLPLIRTCGFPASGSSEHGFAT